MRSTSYLKLLDKYSKDTASSSSNKKFTMPPKQHNDNFYGGNSSPSLIKDCSLALSWILSNTSVTRDDLRSVYRKNICQKKIINTSHGRSKKY